MGDVFPNEEGIIVESGMVSQKEYKVVIPKLTPLLPKDKKYEKNNKIFKNKLLSKSSRVKDSIKVTNYLIAENISDYIIELNGQYGIDGEIALNSFKASTALKQSAGVISSPTGPGDVTTLFPIPLQEIASSKDMQSDGDISISGIHDFEVNIGDKCIVTVVSDLETWKVIHIKDKIKRR